MEVIFAIRGRPRSWRELACHFTNSVALGNKSAVLLLLSWPHHKNVMSAIPAEKCLLSLLLFLLCSRSGLGELIGIFSGFYSKRCRRL